MSKLGIGCPRFKASAVGCCRLAEEGDLERGQGWGGGGRLGNPFLGRGCRVMQGERAMGDTWLWEQSLGIVNPGRIASLQGS